MQKGAVQGPKICALFFREEETTTHLFVRYVFWKHVWKGISHWLSLINLWNEDSIELCLHDQYLWSKYKQYKSISYLVLWGLWLAWNGRIFLGTQIPNFHVSSQVVVLFILYRFGAIHTLFNGTWTEDVHTFFTIFCKESNVTLCFSVR
jgi:hypothetical protein